MAFALPRDPPSDVDYNRPEVKLMLYLHGQNSVRIEKLEFYFRIGLGLMGIATGVLVTFLGGFLLRFLG